MREAAFEIARQSDDYAPSVAHEVIAAFARPFTYARDAWTLAKLRAQLHRLDDHQLEDVGIVRADIDFLAADGLGAKGALARLISDRRTPVRVADRVRFLRAEGGCAWACTRG